MEWKNNPLRFLLALMLFFSHGIVNVIAQEPVVNFDVNFWLALNGETPQAQSDASFDLIYYPAPDAEGQIIFDHETDTWSGSMNLTAGRYKLRVWDEQNFWRNEQEVTALSAILTNNQSGQDYRPLNELGYFNQFSQDLRVYDIVFDLTVEDYYYNEQTGRYEASLNMIFGDIYSADAVDSFVTDEFGSTDSDPETSETSDSSENEGWPVTLQVKDNNDIVLPYVGLTFEFISETIYTDEQGLIRLENMRPGTYNYEIALPEGFDDPLQSGSFQIPDNYDGNEMIPIVIDRQGTSDEEVGAGSLNITVLNDSQQPVSEATVIIDDNSYLTDDNGRLWFEEVPAGTYTVRLDEDGAESVTVEVYSNEVTDYTLVSTQSEETYGHAQVTVSDQEGVAIPNVLVEISGHTGTTDENGQVTIENIATGTHNVYIEDLPDGFDILPESAATVEVVNNETAWVTLTLERITEEATVTIQVRDQDDQPVVPATVIFNEREYEVNQAGDAIILQVEAPGTYSYGLVSIPDGYTGSSDLQTIDVQAGENEPVTLKVEREAKPGSVQFVLTDAKGEALTNVTIRIDDQVVTTNTEGIAVFNDLTVGEYGYTIENLDELYIGERQGKVTVEEDTRTEVNLSFERQVQEGSVRIQVNNEDGKGIANVTVEVANQSAVTNQEGHVTFDAIPEGEYEVQITNKPDNYELPSTAPQIEVVADQMNDLEVVLTEAIELATVTIQVRDQDNLPVVPATIIFGEREYNVNNDGDAILLEIVANKSYTYGLVSLPDGYEGSDERQTLDVVPGDNEPVVLKVERQIKPGSVQFRLIDQLDQPISNVTIQLNDSSIVTNENGYAEKGDLAPGEYRYEILDLAESYEGERSGVVTVEEDKQTDVAISFEREIVPGNAKVIITDGEGNPVANVVMILGNQTATSDSSGLIVFESLTPGDYTLSLSELPAGYDSTFEDTTITIKEGETYETDLKVIKQPEIGGLELHFVDLNQQPIQGVEVKVGERTYTTDAKGIISVTDLLPGEVTYELIHVPAGYLVPSMSDTVTITANETKKVTVTFKMEETRTQTTTTETTVAETTTVETTTAETTTVSDTRQGINESTTLSPEEQSSIDQEANKATKEFVHDDTGVTVRINPEDAKRVVKLDVQKVQPTGTFNGYDADVFMIRLLDRQNQPVTLNYVAEVRIPTRPVTQRIQLVREANGSLNSMMFTLNNQRAVFKTQQLGTYGVIYGNIAPTPSTTEVETTTKEKDLPPTGENNSIWFYIIGVIVLAGGGYLVFNNRKPRK